MKDCMIDLETLGRRPGCVVLSLGAVMFDPQTRELGAEFYSEINKQSCLSVGMHADPDTVAWWDKQNPDARTVLTAAEHEDCPQLLLVLRAFAAWLQTNTTCEQKERRVWGNGASFDQPILTEAYRLAEVRRPWEFWGDMCYRTLKNLNPQIPMAKSGVQHNALADAKQQALHCIKLLTPPK